MLDTGRLDRITTFPALIEYLRDQLDWPIEEFTFDDLTYDWDPSEFGLSSEAAGQIEIKQLRPLGREPWGIFFLSLPHKKLPVTVLRRILGGLAIKKRASANAAERAAWSKEDLLFIAAHGEGGERSLAFAHFHEDKEQGDLPSLRVLGWDEGDTIRRLSDTHRTLKEKLHWQERGEDDAHWRARWNEAFRERPGESIRTSKALAMELARLAREIRRRANELLKEENDKGPLRTLHKAFKEALIHDLKHDDFADMYAQTIAYGLLAARISRESGALVSDNAADLAPPTNPFLKELLQTFLSAGGRKGGMDFDELGVNDVVEMLRRADMRAVLLDFDTKNPSEDPVIHFYELFLKEYDAKKRMQRGVFYTPRPVVSFIVRSVDEVLRTEFGLEDGLASTATWAEVIADKPDIQLPDGAKGSDPFVRILDPATGTGTFLVEVIDLIHGRMVEKWKGERKSAGEIEALWNDYVPANLLPRLYGFELMMAPYAIAHMKLGLKLAETNYHFRSDERARIYLTNALEPAQDFDMQLAFMSEALAHEAQAANKAKEARFTVVIGNPPYAGISANQGQWAINLLRGNDGRRHVSDYYSIAGVPLAEKKLWLQDDYVKFTRLAHYQLELAGTGVLGFVTNNSFIDGPTYRGMRDALLTSFSGGKLTNLHGSAKRDLVGGQPDENVFDIQQAVAISIWWNAPTKSAAMLAELIGTRDGKYKALLSGRLAYEPIKATQPWLIFQTSSDLPEEYFSFPSVKDIFTISSTSVQTSRDAFVIDFNAGLIADRVSDLERSTESQLRTRYGLDDGRNFSLRAAMSDIRSNKSWRSSIIPYLYRCFDVRRALYRSSLVNWPRTEVMRNLDGKHPALLVPRQIADANYHHVFVTVEVPDMCAFSGATKEAAQCFPLMLSQDHTIGDGSNLHQKVTRRFRELVASHESLSPRDIFDWIYAVLHSPAYRSRYADYLKSDFARIPLPGSKKLFKGLAPLGSKLVALHLLDVDTAPELKDPQNVRFAGHGEARVEAKPEWSAAGGNRVPISANRWFEGVPERVWNFQIGGYQPAQKWLKDRAAKGGKKASPGRILTAEDQLHYRRMIVAMDKTIALMAEIDRVIEKHGGWPDAFKGMSDAEVSA